MGIQNPDAGTKAPAAGSLAKFDAMFGGQQNPHNVVVTEHRGAGERIVAASRQISEIRGEAQTQAQARAAENVCSYADGVSGAHLASFFPGNRQPVAAQNGPQQAQAPAPGQQQAQGLNARAKQLQASMAPKFGGEA